MQNFTRIGTIGLLALVALRLGVGWHFFKEGSDKIKSGTFSSEGFLKASNGRMAGFYHGMVWDYEGKIRLNQELMSAEIEKSAERAIKHFGFADTQLKELEAQKKMILGKLKDTFVQYSEPILKLEKGEERVAKMEKSATWKEVDSLRGQKESIEKERLSGVMPALKEIDQIWKLWQDEINSIATPEQVKASRLYRLKKPQEGMISSAVVDRVIPIFDITVGVLLIIGLFVPLAGWAGALFLVSVVLSQFPGDPGTQPTYLYANEALALIVLATIGAGRFGGLDFLIWSWRQNKAAATTPAPK
ncbi:MAG: hypothetical protein U0930_09955 [Pirellulales bacterium]